VIFGRRGYFHLDAVPNAADCWFSYDGVAVTARPFAIAVVGRGCLICIQCA
jgi:hypothetical protein